MTMALRKLELMHKYYGRDDAHKCGDCNHFVQGVYHDKTLRKCKCYGMTHSAASDWAKSWTACGLFCKDYSGAPMIRMVTKRKCNKQAEIPGQIGLKVENG